MPALRRLHLLAALLAALPAAGCAVVWEDEAGRLRAVGAVRAAQAGPEAGGADVSGVDVYGLALLRTRAATGIVLGWARERLVQVGPDGLLAVDCLPCDLARTRIAGPPIQQGDSA